MSVSGEESERWASKMTGGPAGLGNPDDKSLRRIEKEVMIPKIVRERSKTEKCLRSKQAFDQCCLENGPLMVIQCREQNRQFKECMNDWFNNREFYNECKQIYLDRRSEFRRTGVKAVREVGGSKGSKNSQKSEQTPTNASS